MPEQPTAETFFAANRGGGLFTLEVNQRIGAYAALWAYRLGQLPTVLTLTNLVLGLAASVLVVATAAPMARGDAPSPLIGLLALLLWQVAYSLDCADGQLARVAGTGSPAGARVDVLCDVALQISLVAAVGAVAVAYRPGTPAWLVAAFAGTWMVNLVTSVMHSSGSGSSLVTSQSLAVRLVKLIRDYGAVVTVVGLVIAFVPGWTPWLMGVFALINGLFLVASIAAAARASLRRPDTAASPAPGRAPAEPRA